MRFLPKREPSLRALQEDIQRKSLLLQNHLLNSTRNLLEVDQNTNWWPDVISGNEPLWDTPEFFNPLWSGQNIPPTLDKTLRGEILPVYVNWYGLKIIRDYSRRQAQYNPYAMCAIENRCSYICGRGFGYKVVPKNGTDTPEVHYLCSLAQKVIDQFHSSQRWAEKEHECVLRCDRDGEAFQRFFHTGNGKTAVRFIEPEWVRGPTETEEESYGVINKELDIEDVIGYWILEHPPYVAPKEVPAEDVIHYKMNSDSTSKRGLPTLFPVRANLDRAEKLLRNMSVLAQVQSTFAVIRKHKQHSQQAVQGFQQAQATFQYQGQQGSTNYAQQMSPGSIIDEPENTELTFPSHGIDAGALVHVLQAELRAVAARLVMPEYMLTANAEGSNFASIAISESPSVKNFERHQSYFARRFGSGAYAHPRNCGAMWRVIHNAVEYGGLPREILTMCELQVEGPSLIARNKDAETRRYTALNEAGLLSKATWSKYESLDRDNERKQWEKEKNQDLEVASRLEEKQAMSQAETQLKVQMMQQQAQQQMMASQGIPPEQQAQLQQQQANGQPQEQPQQQGQVQLGQPAVTQQQAPSQNGQELGQGPLKDEQAGVYSELHDLVGGIGFFESIKELPIGSRVRGPSGILYEIQEEVIGNEYDEYFVEPRLIPLLEAKNTIYSTPLLPNMKKLLLSDNYLPEDAVNKGLRVYAYGKDFHALPAVGSRVVGIADHRFDDVEKAEQVAKHLREQQGFSNARVLKNLNGHYVAWGDPKHIQRLPQLLSEKNHQELGRLFGYKPEAVKNYQFPEAIDGSAFSHITGQIHYGRKKHQGETIESAGTWFGQ